MTGDRQSILCDGFVYVWVKTKGPRDRRLVRQPCEQCARDGRIHVEPDGSMISKGWTSHD